MNIYIKKSDGSKDLFDEKKLKASLRASGAQKDVIGKIISEISDVSFDGITSNTIYKMAFKLLKEKSKKAALRYNLTNAVALLGPEGFAFEAFLAEIVKTWNYKKVSTGKKIKGHCMIHELDVVGESDWEILTIEAKFHNSRSKKSDLQVILYMKARFQDILDGGYYKDKKPRQIIITNTKFTDNAKKYAKCSGTEVISWDYPKKNLHDLILESNIHPMTALVSLPKSARNKFIERKIVTIKQLAENNFKKLEECKFLSNLNIKKIKEEIFEFFPDKI